MKVILWWKLKLSKKWKGVMACDVSPVAMFWSGKVSYRPATKNQIPRQRLSVAKHKNCAHPFFFIIQYIMSVWKAMKEIVNHTQTRWMVSSISYDFSNNRKSASGQFFVSGEFQHCLDSFDAVQTVSILYRRFQYYLDCPDGFQNCLESFTTLWTFLKLSI